MLTLGFGFFLFMMISSYTANLTTFLISKSKTQNILSVADIQLYHGKACVWPGSFELQMASLFPGLALHGIEDMAHAIADDLDQGKCLGLITAEVDAIYAIRNGRNDDSRRNCNKKVVGHNLLPIIVTWLTNARKPEIASILRWAVASMNDDVGIELLRRKYAKQAGRQCTSREIETAVDQATSVQGGATGSVNIDVELEEMRLGLRPLAGIFVVQGIFLVCAGCAHLRYRYWILPRHRAEVTATEKTEQTSQVQECNDVPVQTEGAQV